LVFLERSKANRVTWKSPGKFVTADRDSAAPVKSLWRLRHDTAEELGISIRSVFRILQTRKDAEVPVAPPVTRIRTRPQVTA